ncbi:MAG: DUF2802 domain-containing protein [Bdellovibrionaceae bacterium]|nr:DUF2802 domain-containing protein [Pseudobdellovibrionaceae bacterium]MDW8189449.1 DUF2802 domain-containing protein [Pseudobdellovibrionaceae bacterium]
MNMWELLLSLFALSLLTGYLILWKKLKALSGQEGSLSQGLQLLQTKIAILEDLSNRVEEQQKQAQIFFDNKHKQMQELLDTMEEKIRNLNEKSSWLLDHGEQLAERELTIKLTRAAILAHKGVPAVEIAKRLGLGLQEAELIASLNSQTLQFDIESLPNWLKKSIEQELRG